MKAKCGVYPRLGQFFGSLEELASAAVMTRPTLNRVLKGEREFTYKEKAAIKCFLVEKIVRKQVDEEKLTLKELFEHDFDESFREKGANT